MESKEALKTIECPGDGEEPDMGEFWSPMALQALLLAIDLLRREAARPSWTD